ncbi:MAG: hypothetical protein QW063_00120 [Candidatus Nanoarchaeia archaeon]
MTISNDDKDMQQAIYEYLNLWERIGCPYTILQREYKCELCSIDGKPCHFKATIFGPYCDRHGDSVGMDKKAGKNYWKRFFKYTQILDFSEYKEILEELVKNRNAGCLDGLLSSLQKAAEAKWGDKIENEENYIRNY